MKMPLRVTKSVFHRFRGLLSCASSENNFKQPSSQRTFSSILPKGFDVLGGGSDDDGLRTSIRAFGDQSFMVNNVMVRQSVMLFPYSFLSWNADRFEDITIESMLPLTLIQPTLEIVFVGSGSVQRRELPKEVRDYFRKAGIMLELSTTPHAASTFNVLNGEGRNVAAALLTLHPRETNKI